MAGVAPAVSPPCAASAPKCRPRRAGRARAPWSQAAPQQVVDGSQDGSRVTLGVGEDVPGVLVDHRVTDGGDPGVVDAKGRGKSCQRDPSPSRSKAPRSPRSARRPSRAARWPGGHQCRLGRARRTPPGRACARAAGRSTQGTRCPSTDSSAHEMCGAQRSRGGVNEHHPRVDEGVVMWPPSSVLGRLPRRPRQKWRYDAPRGTTYALCPTDITGTRHDMPCHPSQGHSRTGGTRSATMSRALYGASPLTCQDVGTPAVTEEARCSTPSWGCRCTRSSSTPS